MVSVFASHLLLLTLLSLLLSQVASRSRHTITTAVPGVHPAGLAWDPTAQHFLIGDRHRPSVYSVSDAGVVERLPIPVHLLPSSSCVAALAIDDASRRLLVAFSRPAALGAYDLRRSHASLFLAPLTSPADSSVPGGVAVDPSTGAALVSAGSAIYSVSVEGNTTLHSSPLMDGGGLAHVIGREYFLAAEKGTGRLFKVDPAEAGSARPVAGAGAGGSAWVVVRSDRLAVGLGGQRARVLKSDDGWSSAGVEEEGAAWEEGWAVAGAAVREGKHVYVMLVGEGEEFKVEEIEWESDREDGEMVWGMVLLAGGLLYFLYWRFMMRRLVTNMNKKRA